MPTYEYACKDCGEHLEVVQSFKDDPLTTCPNCQGALRKVFSAAGLIFKGSGWHIKDYKSSPATTTAPAASTGTDKTASDSGSSSSDSGSSATPTTTTATTSSSEKKSA